MLYCPIAVLPVLVYCLYCPIATGNIASISSGNRFPLHASGVLRPDLVKAANSAPRAIVAIDFAIATIAKGVVLQCAGANSGHAV